MAVVQLWLPLRWFITSQRETRTSEAGPARCPNVLLAFELSALAWEPLDGADGYVEPWKGEKRTRAFCDCHVTLTR